MNEQAMAQFSEYCARHQLQALLLASPFTVTWLTGYAPPIQTGPSPFEGGPALVWWREGEVTLILADSETGAAEATGAAVLAYESYTIERPLAGLANQAAVLRTLLQSTNLAGTVGIELNWLPAALLAVQQSSLPNAALRPVDGEFEAVRAVKTPAEVDKLRASLSLCDLAQRAVRDHAQPGMSELELWGLVKARVESAAGSRLPVLADLVAGVRSADIGGPPSDYRLQPGDAVLLDFVPRRDGYWGDNAGTYFLGEPSAELQKIYTIVAATLALGLDTLKPGVRAGDLDAKVRNAIRTAGFEPYPHHTGHGIGTTYHEEPRIVPYNEMILAPGMVVALEPGIYLPGVGGVRLEHIALVTADGCQVLTTHLPH